ncbi:7-carboxy-7-deazaguanine synthase QueE [Desulfobacterota bacterium AH_259_B03_O07]|nr:7-carboxy-7-deazaguanine synthase QueE [Desulfobacterota bacterium AH_259_B03_O07]
MKISEIFFSIQGEGIEIGLPTVFVRLFACDLRCAWCDTMYAVEGRDFIDMTINEVKSEIEKFQCIRVCMTGGEPLIQRDEVEQLAKDLVSEGFNILLETSGHKDPPSVFWTDSCLISMDCKCPSSKMEEKMDFKLFEKLRPKDQLKFVIKDEVDYNYAKEILKSYQIKASIIFQPVYGTNLKWLTEKTLEDKLEKVRTLPQLHKFIWGEKRGY